MLTMSRCHTRGEYEESITAERRNRDFVTLESAWIWYIYMFELKTFLVHRYRLVLVDTGIFWLCENLNFPGAKIEMFMNNCCFVFWNTHHMLLGTVSNYYVVITREIVLSGGCFLFRFLKGESVQSELNPLSDRSADLKETNMCKRVGIGTEADITRSQR